VEQYRRNWNERTERMSLDKIPKKHLQISIKRGECGEYP
jgi:hypothetical protein